MKLHSPRHVMAQLTEAAALQDEVVHHWLVFEWGQLVFAQLARLWQHLETHEAMA
jgi:hypothetical protein